MNPWKRQASRIGAVLLARLLADMDSEELDVREKTERELERLDDVASPILREFLTGNPGSEARRRARRLLTEALARLEKQSASR